MVRTPLLPADVLITWAACGDLKAERRFVADLLARPDINEALFLASPGLHGAIERWRADPDSEAGQRVERALVKYVARMAGRATPFGLFAGVSSGGIGKETRMELAPSSDYRRRTRLDNDYLFLLARTIVADPRLRGSLRFRPNSSIYCAAGRVRFAAARLDGSVRSYQLVAVDPSPYLDAVLERADGGARLTSLAEALVDPEDGISLEQAVAYIDRLVEAQILVPDLGVQVTGPEPIDAFVEELDLAGAERPAALLRAVSHAMAGLDRAGLGNEPAAYEALACQLAALPSEIDRSRLFQVDMVKPASVTVAASLAAEVARTCTALVSVFGHPEAPVLEDFKRRFRERWEEREVPLAEALDEETGIGFEGIAGLGNMASPLVAGLRFPAVQEAREIGWSRADVHMLRRLGDAITAGEAEITLTESDLAEMKEKDPESASELPDAFAASIRVAAADDAPEVLLEGVNGPSGARILGRFCHSSPEVRQHVEAHLRAEEMLRPEAVFAEIVHLNEGRTGNVLCRPVLRGYEIVFLGRSGAPEERQIRLNDLMLSVRGGRIVLRSRRLDREVIPRLSTAHNFWHRSIGAYRFLCALAGQGCVQTGFSWGLLGRAPYLPRVRIGRTIVSRARWNLGKDDLAPITRAVREADRPGKPPGERRAAVLEQVAALRQGRRLPRFLAVVASDNELPIDLDNALLATAFADELAGASTVRLVELYPAPGRSIVRGPEGSYMNQVVLTFTRARSAEQAAHPGPPSRHRRVAQPQPLVVRSFPPGSEWLYAKIFCGLATADRVLRDAVAPVVRAALAQGDAHRWFFIRYSHPSPHLRVRFQGDRARLGGKVLPALHDALAPLVAIGTVAQVQLDTYVRELERYGEGGMDLVERIFHIDSDAVLDIVERLDGDAGAAARWRLALVGIEGLLEALGLVEEARARLARRARDVLGNEHRADPAFWHRVGERFTRERSDLELLFARDRGHPLAPGFAILDRRDERLAEVGAELRAREAAGALTPGVEQLAWSLTHMHANRLLHAAQRAQEMVLYDFLRRLHASRLRRFHHPRS